MYFYDFDKTFDDSSRDHWIISDPHYGHKNLVKGISNWSNKDGCRPFQTQEEHDRAIVDGINSVAKPDDVLWVLGDWCFGGIQNIWEFRKQVNCKTIYFILGNHDHHIRANKNLIIPEEDYKHVITKDEAWEAFDRNIADMWHLDYNGNTYSMWYDNTHDELVIEAQELFDWVAERIETKIFGQRVIFDHFAGRVWNRSHHGAWHIHGHSHGSLPEYTSYYAGRPQGDEVFRTIDVGFECAYDILGKWRPFKFQELQRMMASRPKLKVDHHNENTAE